MKLREPDPRRVRIQVTELAPGGIIRPGTSRTMMVFDTDSDVVMQIIREALQQEVDAGTITSSD